MADLAATKTREDPKSELWEDGDNHCYDKTLDLCGVSQNIHFDKNDGFITVGYAWYQVIVLVTVPCAVGGDGDCLYQLFYLFWETKIDKNVCGDIRPTFVQNLKTLPWKISPRMSKPVGSLNGPLCVDLMRQNHHDGTSLRSKNSKCLCHIRKWFEKNADLRAPMVIFNVRSWTTCKNIVKDFLWLW